jgi:hypothetical protein
MAEGTSPWGLPGDDDDGGGGGKGVEQVAEEEEEEQEEAVDGDVEEDEEEEDLVLSDVHVGPPADSVKGFAVSRFVATVPFLFLSFLVAPTDSFLSSARQLGELPKDDSSDDASAHSDDDGDMCLPRRRIKL